MTTSSGVGGGSNIGYQAVVSFNSNEINIKGNNDDVASSIPISSDGYVDLEQLAETLEKETGISKETIIKDYLPGIVKQIEAHGAYKLRGMELLKDMATDRMDTGAPSVNNGPQSVTDGADAEQKKILLIFQEAGQYVNPNASTNPQLNTQLKADLNDAIQHGSNGFTARLQRHMQEYPNGDVMASLFYVFQESIKQTNEDKAYFLNKLSDMNKLSEAMSDYLKTLESKSQELEKKTVKETQDQGKDYHAGTTQVDVAPQSFDTSGLGADGKANFTVGDTRPMNNTALGNEIKKLETDMETVRNKREEFQTMFENFDQKSNQLFNMLSTVLKNVKEMQSSVTRNLL